MIFHYFCPPPAAGQDQSFTTVVKKTILRGSAEGGFRFQRSDRSARSGTEALPHRKFWWSDRSAICRGCRDPLASRGGGAWSRIQKHGNV